MLDTSYIAAESETPTDVPVRNEKFTSAKNGHIGWLAEVFAVTAWLKTFSKNQIRC